MADLIRRPPRPPYYSKNVDFREFLSERFAKVHVCESGVDGGRNLVAHSYLFSLKIALLQFSLPKSLLTRPRAIL